MQSIINYFSTIPDYMRTVILASGFVLMWMIESLIPLFKNKTKKLGHAGINLFFTFTTILVNFLFAVLIVKACDFTTDHHFGILYLVNLPLWLLALLGFMLLDLIGAYAIHVLEHNVKWMWKFHAVHHTDPHVNTTTALRHHPGESVFRATFAILVILIAGVPVWLVLLYQTCSGLFSQFNHANIHLPKWLSKSIEVIFVSPDMHKVHHHWLMPTTDRNYGNIFSIWDRLFGTYVKKDLNELQYGLDIFPEEDAQTWLPRLLKIPFEPYRAPVGAKFGDKPQEETSHPEFKAIIKE
ncbi:MAG: sterol desaturase family protein [Chitinophagales bacterium]